MKNYQLVMLILIVLLPQSCAKDKNENDNNKTHTVRIEKNGNLYKEFNYDDSVLLSLKDSSGSNYTSTIYSYDSSGKNIASFIVSNGNGDRISRYVIEYQNGLISALTIYKYDNNKESLDQKATVTYDINKFTINTSLPETFYYAGKNISTHGFVQNERWTEYDYTYDSHPSIISKIGLPLTDVESISENNIISVISRWTEYTDNMTNGNSTILHVDTLYQSNYSYNELGYPTIELRRYKTKVDTFKYMYE